MSAKLSEQPPSPNCSYRAAKGASIRRVQTKRDLSALLALVVFTTSSVFSAGCALSGPRGLVAVMPVDGIGVASSEAESLRAAVEKKLSENPEYRAADRREVDAVGAGDPRCGESETCMAGVGRRIPAQYVLMMTLAGLGKTRLVRSRLVASDREMLLKDFQDSVSGEPIIFEPFAQNLSERLFPAKLEESRWYKNWWIWAIAGGVAAAVGGTILLTRSSSDNSGASHIGDL